MKLNIENYVKERDEALTKMDMEYLRSKMPGATDEVIEIAAHKARYECTGIRDDLRVESGRWLRERGYTRFCGGHILPGEALPI